MKQFFFNHYGSIITVAIVLFAMIKAHYDVKRDIKANAKWWEENTQLYIDAEGRLCWSWKKNNRIDEHEEKIS